MARQIYKKIIELVLKAAELARSIGITNLLQPGLVKELIIAGILGHEPIFSKRDADAHAPGNPQVKYEYLTCKEGGTGQLDRMFKEPPSKRAESLSRITRNKKLFLAVFYADNQTKVKVIYELEPDDIVRETDRQLDRSSNPISHVGFTEDWARDKGNVVFIDKKGPQKRINQQGRIHFLLLF